MLVVYFTQIFNMGFLGKISSLPTVDQRNYSNNGYLDSIRTSETDIHTEIVDNQFFDSFGSPISKNLGYGKNITRGDSRCKVQPSTGTNLNCKQRFLRDYLNANPQLEDLQDIYPDENIDTQETSQEYQTLPNINNNIEEDYKKNKPFCGCKSRSSRNKIDQYDKSEFTSDEDRPHKNVFLDTVRNSVRPETKAVRYKNDSYSKKSYNSLSSSDRSLSPSPIEKDDEYVRRGYERQFEDYFRQGDEYIRQGNERQGDEYIRQGNERQNDDCRRFEEEHLQESKDHRLSRRHKNKKRDYKLCYLTESEYETDGTLISVNTDYSSVSTPYSIKSEDDYENKSFRSTGSDTESADDDFKLVTSHAYSSYIPDSMLYDNRFPDSFLDNYFSSSEQNYDTNNLLCNQEHLSYGSLSSQSRYFYDNLVETPVYFADESQLNNKPMEDEENVHSENRFCDVKQDDSWTAAYDFQSRVPLVIENEQTSEDASTSVKKRQNSNFRAIDTEKILEIKNCIANNAAGNTDNKTVDLEQSELSSKSKDKENVNQNETGLPSTNKETDVQHTIKCNQLQAKYCQSMQQLGDSNIKTKITSKNVCNISDKTKDTLLDSSMCIFYSKTRQTGWRI